MLVALDAGMMAVARAAGHAAPGDRTGCEGWTVHDLVRHLEATAGAYLLWAGGAAGDRVVDLRDDAARRDHNHAVLDILPHRPTAEHLDRFLALADDHLRLSAALWDRPMARTPTGAVLTAGQHTALAALEWHLHAWDMARGSACEHHPDPLSLRVLLEAWPRALTAGDTRVDVDRWEALLAATGRAP